MTREDSSFVDSQPRDTLIGHDHYSTRKLYQESKLLASEENKTAQGHTLESELLWAGFQYLLMSLTRPAAGSWCLSPRGMATSHPPFHQPLGGGGIASLSSSTE